MTSWTTAETTPTKTTVVSDSFFLSCPFVLFLYLVIYGCRKGLSFVFLFLFCPLPLSAACNVVLTVKHILIECADLLEIRNKYFEEKSLYSLFRNVIPEVFFYFFA